MKTNKKLIIIISAVLISLAAGSVVWHVARRTKPVNFIEQKPEQIFKYLRSEEFRNLDPNTRRSYARQAFGQIMTQRAKEYSELPPEKRTAYLDEVIDSMQSQRREFESRRAEFMRPRDGEPNRRTSNPSANPSSRPRRKPEDMRARREPIPPATRAQIAAFRQAMGERMRQRGITPRGRY